MSHSWEKFSAYDSAAAETDAAAAISVTPREVAEEGMGSAGSFGTGIRGQERHVSCIWFISVYLAKMPLYLSILQSILQKILFMQHCCTVLGARDSLLRDDSCGEYCYIKRSAYIYSKKA